MVGVPEDTIQSCYTVTPKAPRIDAVKYMVHATKVSQITTNFTC